MSMRFRIIFSTACAVLAALICVRYAAKVQGEADRERAEVLAHYGGEVVTLVVSTDTLEKGDVATQGNVAMREWLVDLAPEGAITNLDDVLGKEVGNAAPKGVPLTDVTFRDTSTMAEVPSGRVAVTLPVSDRLGVPRDVEQGTQLAAYEVTGEGTNLISASCTVLATPSQSVYGSSSQLTLAVPPQDVPQLLSASASSDLRLVMPSAQDVAAAKGEGGEEGASTSASGVPADPAAPVEVKAEEAQRKEATS